MSLLVNALRQSFINTSAPAKLVLLVFLVLLFALLGSVVAIVTELYRMIENPDAGNIDVIKLFQIVQSVFLFIVPALIAAWLFSENTFTYLRADQKTSGITLLVVSISLFLAVPMLNMITNLNAQLNLPVWLDGLEKKMMALEESAGRLTELFLDSDSAMDLAINFLMIAILPAIGEELLFRGILQRLFIEWTKNNHYGIIISAFLFSFIHFQFYGFLPRFLLGLYFGYLMLWSSSLWVPVIGHMINNGMAVVYYHFANQPVGETALDKVGTADNGNYVIYLSVFFTCVCLGMIYVHEKGGRIPEN